MDVISDVIGSVRTGQAFARRIGESGDWGRRYVQFTGVGFHVLLHGSGWLIPAAGPPVAVSGGDIVLSPAGDEHGLSPTPCTLAALPEAPMSAEPSGPGPHDVEFLCGAYRLGRGQVHRFLQGLPATVVLSPADDRAAALRSLTALLADDVAAARPGAQATRGALIDLLLVQLLRLWQDQHEADRPDVDPGIATALRLIDSRPEEPWTVRRLTEAAGMSRTTFTRRFTEAAGKPPMAYVIGARLARGARLLRETEAPLAAVARQAGYANEFAFAAAFRREFGVAPGRFRRESVLTAPCTTTRAG
ncbi:AraC family transcriptional regulator [Jidongwangia harbinensis]|uniref:AraC family transcriptional regulator n=1 Tax=Jidongwangia harbinensis TaxID=2878561 RepID=UPI001CD9D3B7|nr:AraC family transcriptional regulator [Jidongwangia harbinensis]MCA2213351.1 AraC family transcriptional regulator [Jidongwangia harbinensis]